MQPEKLYNLSQQVMKCRLPLEANTLRVSRLPQLPRAPFGEVVLYHYFKSSPRNSSYPERQSGTKTEEER